MKQLNQLQGIDVQLGYRMWIEDGPTLYSKDHYIFLIYPSCNTFYVF